MRYKIFQQKTDDTEFSNKILSVLNESDLEFQIVENMDDANVILILNYFSESARLARKKNGHKIFVTRSGNNDFSATPDNQLVKKIKELRFR